MSRTPAAVVITGASSGIGRATAHAFARTGAKLVLAARRQEALDDVVQECASLGAEAIAVVTDVSSNKQVKALAEAAVQRFGSIDVWVNGASVAAYGPFLDTPLDDFRRVLDVNVMGYVYGARAALNVMVQQGHGSIVNIASLIGEVPQPYGTAYAMSKAAVRSLGVSLRQELSLDKQKHISVSTVLPATIDTPFFRHAANYMGREVVAMPPVYPPELVALAIVKVAAKPKAETAVGAAGKVFVREHRRHPEAVEAQMAAQTKAAQFSRKYPASATDGILYASAPDHDATVTGGWDGARRSKLRKAVGATLLLGAGALAITRASKSKR